MRFHPVISLLFAVALALPAGGQLMVEPETVETDETYERIQEAVATAATEPEALRALVEQVNLQRRRGDYRDGLAGARDGLQRARRLQDPRLQVEFLYLLGRIHWNLTDYPHSIESHLTELRLAEQLGDATLLARCHVGLGLTYQRFGRAADALAHYDLALGFARKAGDRNQLASVYNSLGNHYLATRDYDRAGEMHTQALQLREALASRRAIADSFTNLGLVADAKGDSRKALDYLQRALVIYEPLKLRRYLANTHRRMAAVLRELKRTDESLDHLQKALALAETLGSEEVMAAIYQELAATHEARGEFAAALQFERQQAGANEAMRGAEDRRRMGELRAFYEAEQRDSEIRQRRFQNIALAASLVLGVVIFGAVIVVQRVRLHAERRLHAVTEHARERAAAAERLKSRLLQMASHDLKVPLTALNATAELIARAPDDGPVVRRLAAGIQADTARMRSLVRDFLDASAIEDGNLQLHPAELTLADVARFSADALQPVAAAKRQRLSCVAPEKLLPKVRADADRLRQVFDNLIGNALKFTPPDGEIHLVSGDASGWVFVEVRDSGPGLGPADFAKIFGPYQTLSAAPTGKEESTGLGLFIARELVTLQGGRLEVQSQPGKGAVFRVLLPAVSAGQEN